MKKRTNVVGAGLAPALAKQGLPLPIKATARVGNRKGGQPQGWATARVAPTKAVQTKKNHRKSINHFNHSSKLI